MFQTPFSTNSNKLIESLQTTLYNEPFVFIRELIANSIDAINDNHAKQLHTDELSDFDMPEMHDTTNVTFTDVTNVTFTDARQATTSRTDSTDSTAVVLDTDIYIQLNNDNHTLMVMDYGIGMDQNDLIQYLGCLGSTSKKINNIGKFGIGFYSVFAVAEKVHVYTRKNNGTVFLFTSDGSSYTINEAPESSLNETCSGTIVVIYPKPEFVEQFNHEYIANKIIYYCKWVQNNICYYMDDSWKVLNSTKLTHTLTDKYTALQQYDEPIAYFSFDISHPEFEGKVDIWVPSVVNSEIYEENFVPFQDILYHGLLVKRMELLPPYFRFLIVQMNFSRINLTLDRKDIVNEQLKGIIEEQVTVNIWNNFEQIHTNTIRWNEGTTKWEQLEKSYYVFLRWAVMLDYKYRNKIVQLLTFETFKGHHVNINDFTQSNVQVVNEMHDGVMEQIKVIYYYTGSVEELNEIVDDYDKDILMFTNKIDHFMAQNFRNYLDIRVASFTRFNTLQFLTQSELPMIVQTQESLRNVLDKEARYEFINNPKMKKYLLRTEYGWTSHMTESFKTQPFRLNYLEKSSEGHKIIIFNLAYVNINLLLKPTPEQCIQLQNWYNMFLLLHGYKPTTMEPLRHYVNTLL